MKSNLFTPRNITVASGCAVVLLSAGYLIRKAYIKYSNKIKLENKLTSDLQKAYDSTIADSIKYTDSAYLHSQLSNGKYLSQEDMSLITRIVGRYNSTALGYKSYIATSPTDSRCYRKMDSISQDIKTVLHIYDVIKLGSKDTVKSLMIMLEQQEKTYLEERERREIMLYHQQAHNERMAKIKADKEIEMEKLSNERYKYSQLAGTAKAFIESKKDNDD